MEHAPQAEHLRFLFDPGATLAAFAGQRRRFAATIEDLSGEELAAPSRCEDWTVADVLRHLVWVDVTVRSIWSGDLSDVGGFDPRVTPNEAVLRDRSVPDEAIRERYLESTPTMLRDLVDSGPERFGRPSLSPAGSVPWWMSAVHIGWDSSVHERDAMLPLDRPVEQLDEETVPCLAYSLALMSFFAGPDPMAVRIGSLQLSRDSGPVTVQARTNVDEAADPAATSSGTTVVMQSDDPVACIDAISGRCSLEQWLRGDPAMLHRLGGMARYFTSPTA